MILAKKLPKHFVEQGIVTKVLEFSLLNNAHENKAYS